MKQFRSARVLALILVVACVAVATAGKYNEKSLVGTWEFDMLKMMKEAMKATEMPPGMDIEKMTAGMYLRITFKKDGTYLFETKTPMEEKTEEGVWVLVSTKDDEVVVKATDKEGVEQTVSMTFKDKDHFDAVMSDDKTMTMSAARVKKDKKKDKEPETEKKG